MIRTAALMLVTSALALRAADDAAATAAPAVDQNTGVFEFPNLPGKHSLDLTTIPAAVRLDFLKSATRAYIQNRLNGLHTRHNKREDVLAWNAYDAATAADPLQSAVAKPTTERPGEPDYQKSYNEAVADLVAGNIRKVGDGEPKARKTKDPLIALVTDVVVRDVFNSKRAADPKYGFLAAKAEVGTDGIAYLDRMIAAKVDGGADKAALEKMKEEKYLKPARAMLGITSSKAVNDLPSIL